MFPLRAGAPRVSEHAEGTMAPMPRVPRAIFFSAILRVSELDMGWKLLNPPTKNADVGIHIGVVA
jgi:hypothetical protein